MKKNNLTGITVRPSNYVVSNKRLRRHGACRWPGASHQAFYNVHPPDYRLAYFGIVFVDPVERHSIARKDGLPVLGHVYQEPAMACRFVEPTIKPTDMALAVIGPFSFGVRVMDNQSKPWPVASR